MSDWIDDTLADFGRRLGLDRLDCGAHGVAQLALAGGGLIAVEPVRRGDAGEVLIYVGRPAGHDAPRLAGVPQIASAHPSPLSAHAGFFGSRPFSRANAALVAQGGELIDWRLA